MISRRRITTSAIALLLLFEAGSAFAHAVAVWAEITGAKVEVESYFSNGKPVRRAEVEVRSSAGEVVAKGAMSAKGRWQFDVPRRQAYIRLWCAQEKRTAEALN